MTRLEKAILSTEELICFYDAIPEEQWCMGTVENNQGQRCVMGHYLAARWGCARPDPTDWSRDLWGEFYSILDRPWALFKATLSHINENQCEINFGATPKQRVLAALKQVRKMEEKKC